MGIFSAGSASVNIVPDFSGAQKVIGRWAAGRSVDMPVKLDMRPGEIAKTHAEVAARPAKMHVHLDIDHKDLLKTADFMLGFSTIGKSLKGLFSPKVIGLTDLVGVAGSLGAALSQAAGAAALIPAGIAAAAVPAATLAMGIKGMGDAFKALASGDAAKINEAMKNLAPNAREFVTQIHALGPAFKDLRLDVQNQLFDGLGKQVANLARSELPMLHSTMGEIASAFNAGFSQMLDVLGNPQGMAETATVMGNISTTMWNAQAAAGPLTQALLTITSVGSKFLPGMAQSFAGMAQSFNDWVQKAASTGQLATIIQVALDRLRQVWDLVMAAGKALISVFGPGVAAGVDLISRLTDYFNMMAQAASSVTGKSGLTTFFGSLAQTFKILQPLIGQLFQVLFADLLPVFGKITEAAAPLIASLGGQFLDMLHTLLPIIYPTIVNAILAVANAVAPLIPIFTQVAQAVLPVLADVLSRMAPIIGEVASLFGAAFAKAMIMLTPLLQQLGDAFIQVLQALAPIIPPLLQMIMAVLPPLIKLFQAVIPVVVQIVQALAPLIVQLAQVLTPILQTLANIVLWAFQTIIGPVVTWVVKSIVVPAIQLVIDIIKLLWTGLQWAWDNVLSPVFHWIGDLWGGVVKGMRAVYDNVLHPMWQIIVNAVGWVRDTFANVVKGIGDIWDGIKKAVAVPINFVINTILNNGLFAAWNWIVDLLNLPGNGTATGGWKLHINPIPGFRRGGYTGDVDPSQVAGLTHGREFVMDAQHTSRWRWLLEAIHADRLPGFQSGGYTGDNPGRGAQFGSSTDTPHSPGNIFTDVGQVLTKLTGSIAEPITRFLANFGSSPFMQALVALPKWMIGGLWGFAKSAVQKFVIGPSNDPGNLQGIWDVFNAIAYNFGWQDPDQQAAVHYVILHESGGNPRAQNPVSSASGLPQMIDGTWARFRGIGASSFAHAKDAPVSEQVWAFYRYVKAVYGDPKGASFYWNTHGNYDSGGWLPPGYSLSYNGTGRPEAVLDAAQSDRLAYVLSGRSGGSGGPGMLSVAGFVNNGTVLMVDPEEQARKDKRGVSTALISLGLGQ